jgi:hypothetical protein
VKVKGKLLIIKQGQSHKPAGCRQTLTGGHPIFRDQLTLSSSPGLALLDNAEFPNCFIF